jgi:hypothetical protein
MKENLEIECQTRSGATGGHRDKGCLILLQDLEKKCNGDAWQDSVDIADWHIYDLAQELKPAIELRK